MGSREGFTVRNFIVCAVHLTKSGWWSREARMEEGRSAFKMLTSKPTGKRHLGRPSVDEMTILEWNLKK